MQEEDVQEEAGWCPLLSCSADRLLPMLLAPEEGEAEGEAEEEEGSGEEEEVGEDRGASHTLLKIGRAHV